MGCCSTTLNIPHTLTPSAITLAIDRGKLKQLLHLKSLLPTTSEQALIDMPFTTIRGLNLSPLGYSLITNKFKVFKFLIKSLGASILSLESLLHSQSKSILEIVCQYGYSDFIRYLIPILTGNILELYSTDIHSRSVTLEFSQAAKNDYLPKHQTPVQLAAENNHLTTIDLIHQHFKDSTSVPFLLDIHYQDELTGENCALIACRKGYYTLVKYLHEECKANFTVLNKRNESALVITAIGSKKNCYDDNFSHIFVYLIEVVHVDFEADYEEIMLALEDDSTVDYFTKALKAKGIQEDKNAIERKFRIVNYAKRWHESIVDKAEIIKDIGERESFDSNVSSVRHEGKVSAFFSSILSLVTKN